MAFLFLLVFLLQPHCSHGGRLLSASSSPADPSCSVILFTPSTGVVISIISAIIAFSIVATVLFICFRNDNPSSSASTATIAAISAPETIAWGLEKSVIDSFPVMLYSEVKEFKLGEGTLECAVCLCEFEDADSLRLLPDCSHAFHPHCIDVWLHSHTTCPVCRDDLTPSDGVPASGTVVGGAEDLSTGEEMGRTPSEGERFVLRLPLSLRERVMARKLERSVTLGHPCTSEEWRVSLGLSGRKEWAAMSDRLELLGRKWWLRSPEGGGGSDSFSRRLEGFATFVGETSTDAGSFRSA